MQRSRPGRSPARRFRFSRLPRLSPTFALVLALMIAFAASPLAAQETQDKPAAQAAEQPAKTAPEAPREAKDEAPAKADKPSKAPEAKAQEAQGAQEGKDAKEPAPQPAPKAEAPAAPADKNAAPADKDRKAPNGAKEAAKEAPAKDASKDAPSKEAPKDASSKEAPKDAPKESPKDAAKDVEPRKDTNKDASHPQQAQGAPAAKGGEAGQAQTDHAQAQPQKDQAQAEQEEEDQTWKIVQQRYGEELAGLAASAQALTEGLDGRLKAARQLAGEMDRRQERIKAQQTLADANPWEMRFVVRSAQRLEREAQAEFAPHLGQIAELERVERKLGELEAEFKEQLKDNPIPEMTAVLNGLLGDEQKIKGRLKGLSRRLSVGLAPVRDTAERIAKQRARLEEGLPAVWRAFFFEPASSLFNPQAWKLFAEEGGRWRQGLEQQTLSFSRVDKPEARAALLKIAVYALLIGGAALWATKLLARRRPYLVDWGLVRRSALILSLAVSTILAVATAQSDRLGLLAVFGQILAASGLASAAWLLRSRLLPEEIRGLAASPLTPLLGLFCLGILLQIMAVPGPTLAPFWIAALAVAFWALSRRARHPSASLESWLNSLSRFLLVALAGMTVLGWEHLSVLSAVVWFLIGMALTFGVCVSSLLKAWHLRNGEGAAHLVEGLVQGLGFPAIALGLTAIIVAWLAAHLGGEVFLEQIAALQIGWGAVSLNVFKLVLVFTLYFVTRSAVYVSGSLLRQLPDRWPGFDRGVSESLQTVSAYALWGAFALTALYLLGVNLASLAVVAGGLSVGIGFGMQNIVNNFISGLILLSGRAVQTGDVIQLGDMQGVVKKIQIRNAIVQTGDNATIFVPNSDLLTAKLVNWSHKDPRVRREIPVGVAYGASTDLVARLLLESAKEQPHVLQSPAPDIIFKDFGANSLVFVLRFWVAHVNKALTTTSEVRYNIERKFRDNGIEIASPK